MRSEPTFAAAVQREVVGDDPLGLAAVNERLYGSAFPGINNVVRYIRVYAAICWMTQRVSEVLARGAAETAKEATALYQGAIEKMELMLLWANRRVPGLAGSTRPLPDHDDLVVLRFETFGSNDASLFEAATYRPSLTTGLQFLEPRAGHTFGCLPLGEKLAEAFDEVVRELPGYRWLRAPEKLEGRRRYALQLASALDVRQPSAPEKRAFLDSFFPPDVAALRGAERARWCTLMLMLEAVRAIGDANAMDGLERAATEDEIRACMARGMAPDGTRVVWDETATVQAWWAVLQVRQLQRLALEALYCVVERWIGSREADVGNRSVDDCAKAVAASAGEYISDSFAGCVGELWSYFGELRGANATLYEAAALWRSDEEGEQNEADVFTHIRRLQNRNALEFGEGGGSEAVADAYIALGFCAYEVENLSRNAEALKAMKDDRDVCSLLRLLAVMQRHQSATMPELLEHLVREWVLLRHFAVVAARSVVMDGKNRFRFVLGDYGLERFDSSQRLPVPVIAQDRLLHALYLCDQSGLLSERAGGYSLTSAGRQRLRRAGRSV